jgi:hypothetical protein
MLLAFISLFVFSISFTPSFAQGGKEMSPEAKAMMEAWEKASTPNENHQRLAKSVGTWNFTTKWWTNPGAPPTESGGTAINEMIHGGRFLKETVKSQMMGQSFEGIAYTGYDNVKKAYVSTWMDNMSTGIIVYKGSWNEETKTYTWHSDYVDVMTGETMKMRMVNKVESADWHVAEFFEIGPDGKEFQSMEIIYTRQ